MPPGLWVGRSLWMGLGLVPWPALASLCLAPSLVAVRWLWGLFPCSLPRARAGEVGWGELPCLSPVTAVLRGCEDTDTGGRRSRLRRGPLRLDAEAEMTDALPTQRGIWRPRCFPEILLPVKTVGTRLLVVPEKHRLHTVCPQVPHLQRG